VTRSHSRLRARRLAAGAAALVLLAAGRPAAVRAQSTYEQLQTFSGVLSHVRVNYVDSVDTGELVRASIEGMLRSLDPHSRYVSLKDFELTQRWDRGELAGVGLALEDVDGRPTVLTVQPGGPAAKAGVLAGDRLRSVNDSSVAGVAASALGGRLLGDKGTRVRLTFERGAGLSADSFAVTLKRAILEHHVVSAPRMGDPVTGYVRLTEFTPLAPKELLDALGKLRGLGAKQYILDLRGNGGGSVDAMVEIASAFLPAKVEIFHTQGRKRTGVDSMVTKEAGEYVRPPLVVLVDEGTASASEMLTGTLQDHDRALVVGRRTFGKALMQMALPLPGGDVIWLTTARVVTPSGRVIQRRYHGLAAEQYYAFAGKSGAAEDTAGVFKTEHGRSVRGGGGIEPDVERPAAELPVWFSVAADSNFVAAVADSVATTLPLDKAGRDAWTAAAARWDAALVTPFLARIRTRLHVAGEADAPLRARLGRILAARAAEVRWGAEAAEELVVRNDPDVRLAVEQMARLPVLLTAH
jgi:carboxyl-terminal processing protease